jgi:adenylate cyclase
MSDPPKVSRRLVAVFAADVEGYSRLMGADEVHAQRGLGRPSTFLIAILYRVVTDYAAAQPL